MQGKMYLIRSSLRASAVIAVIYTVIVISCNLLVTLLTDGSWKAAFLGIGWATFAGFELGFIGVLVTGMLVAGIFAFLACLVQKATKGKVNNVARSTQVERLSYRSWEIRLLAACMLIPVLAFFILHVLASTAVFSPAIASEGEKVRSPGGPVPMSSKINTSKREAEPSFTADGKTMYFNCSNGDICISQLTGDWEGGNWSQPKHLAAPINTEYEEIEPVINLAGDKLYFTSIRPVGLLKGLPFLSPLMNVFRVANLLASGMLGQSIFSGLGLDDVYVSYWIDGAWSDPISINDGAEEPPVNTIYADHCLFFSTDGNEAFWTSNRPGGFGDNDIWTSHRVGGKWSEPQNLGKNVNGPGSEHTSIPAPDGMSLYVTATREDGFGGEDNYITTRDAQGNWGPLVNLGPLINGQGDDRCPAWTPDFQYFLFDSTRPGGFGARDIWWMNFKDIKGNKE